MRDLKDDMERDDVAAFDTLFTSNQIQIMKLLLPCFDDPLRSYLAVLIKYREFLYTLSLTRNRPFPARKAANDPKERLRAVLPTLAPYCDERQKQTVRQLEQIFASWDLYQEARDLLELMQEAGVDPAKAFFSDESDEDPRHEPSDQPQSGDGAQAENPFRSPPDLESLISLLSPRQKELIDLLKGDKKHE